MEISVEDVTSQMTNKDIIREINEYISLRKSKYGMYLYYKTPNHKKPEFISLKFLKNDVEQCDNDSLIEYVSTHKKK